MTLMDEAGQSRLRAEAQHLRVRVWELEQELGRALDALLEAKQFVRTGPHPPEGEYALNIVNVIDSALSGWGE